MGRRARCGVAAALSGLVLGGASLAWACIPSSRFWSDPDFAPPGGQARLQGTGFAGSVVDIHWGGEDGPIVVTAPAPDFSVMVTVPSTADGVYTLYAIGHGTGTLPSSTSWNRTPFEVASAGTRGAWGDGGWGQAPTAPSSGPTSPGPVPGATAPSPSAVLNQGPGAASPDPAPNPTSQPTVTPARPSNGSNGTPAPASSSALRLRPSAPGTPPAAAARPPVAPAPDVAGQPVRLPDAPAAAAAPTDAPRIGALPDPTDLWSAVQGNGTSLTSRDDAAPSRHSSGPSVGFGLLGVGALALVAGLATAGSRRRPSMANIVRRRG